jgi:hypothetical protein
MKKAEVVHREIGRMVMGKLKEKPILQPTKGDLLPATGKQEVVNDMNGMIPMVAQKRIQRKKGLTVFNVFPFTRPPL